MRIGVIGGGVVGKATARCFMEHAEEVCVYDAVKERSTHSVERTLNCDLVFVCLPTPTRSDGSLDVSSIEAFFASVRDEAINFVLRSTVPIGTTRMLTDVYKLTNLVHSPEFLTARCAATDAQLPARNVIGDVDATRCCAVLRQLYFERFPGVPTYVMRSDESEAVKLIQNSFFAVKISFFNEVNFLCQRLGLDWYRVLAAVLADGRIAHSHTRVPGPDGKHGFGGACLPKDLAGLVHQMQSYDMDVRVTKAALDRNTADRERT